MGDGVAKNCGQTASQQLAPFGSVNLTEERSARDVLQPFPYPAQSHKESPDHQASGSAALPSPSTLEDSGTASPPEVSLQRLQQLRVDVRSPRMSSRSGDGRLTPDGARYFDASSKLPSANGSVAPESPTEAPCHVDAQEEGGPGSGSLYTTGFEASLEESATLSSSPVLPVSDGVPPATCYSRLEVLRAFVATYLPGLDPEVSPGAETPSLHGSLLRYVVPRSHEVFLGELLERLEESRAMLGIT